MRPLATWFQKPESLLISKSKNNSSIKGEYMFPMYQWIKCINASKGFLHEYLFSGFMIYGESHYLPLAREATLSSTPGQDTMFKTEVKMHDAAIRVRRLLQGCQQTLRYSHKSKEKHWVNTLFWLIGWQLIKIGIIWAVGSPPFEWQSESKLRER